MKTSSPVKRHGGKSYMAKQIVSLMPPHTRYIEPFFGSGAVLFARDGENVAEFVNDIDRNLSQFWFTLSNESLFQDFNRKVQATPFSEPVFDAAIKRLSSRLEGGPTGTFARMPVDAAVDFFIVNRQSRQALGKDFATPTRRLRRGMNEQVSAWLSAVDGLPEFHARLRRVEIRCMDAVEFIAEIDSPETFIYADPPYVHSTRNAKDSYGPHEMSDEQHCRLLATLAGVEGKFILSGYPNAIYDDVAARNGWRHVDIEIDNKASGAKQKEKKIERLWMNY